VPAGALAHALRHSFAPLALERADVVEVRELLGRASLATTSRDLDANGRRLRRVVAAHPSQRALGEMAMTGRRMPTVLGLSNGAGKKAQRQRARRNGR